MARNPSRPVDPPDPPDPPAKPDIPDKPDMMTAPEEQRARSAVIEQMGVDEWKGAHDERTKEEKAGRAVRGVQPGNPEVRNSDPEARSWEGSTRSTPAARKAQNPAASR